MRNHADFGLKMINGSLELLNIVLSDYTRTFQWFPGYRYDEIKRKKTNYEKFRVSCVELRRNVINPIVRKK